jgi:uncharacterized phage protein (TIGR01671 family)
MREIKFRAWDYTSQIMSYSDEEKSLEAFFASHNKDYDDVVFMQYTGLKDNRGYEIYEGDVVNMKVLIDYNVNTEIDRTYTGVVAVIPSKGACMKRPKFIDRCEDDRTVWCDYNKPIAAYRSEVVGNIYENPELMEGKE